MLEQNVRGIVAMYLDYMPPTLMNYAKRGGHVVAVTTTKQNFEGAHNILIDKVLEAYTATKHLVDLGHKKIALFMNEINCEIRRDKVEGYQKAMQEAGLEKDGQYIYAFEPESAQCREKHNYSTESDVGCNLAKQMLAKSPEVTAIVCMNDLIALGTMAAIRAAGKRVPDDYSVCGFDDAFFAAFLDPPLTTMAVKKYQWGEALVAYLLELVESHDEEKIESVLGTEVVQSAYLIKRGSTSKPRLEYK